MTRTHAFTDDVLADHDGLAVAELIRSRQVSREEVRQAALARAAAVEHLNLVQVLDDRPVPVRVGAFSGVPTFIKDNTDVAGLPSTQGSEAFVAKAVPRTAGFAKLFLGAGMVPLGKSRLPEFGFNASTEFMTQEPARNPWNPDYSTGASSGGAAGLVAAGVVPFAHANDGGGSIRIPAAACGLVGLKPTRGRHVLSARGRVMPVNIVSEGVVTRTVRDTAYFLAATERTSTLPPIGLVEGPSPRRLRFGLVLDSVNAKTDDETRAAVLATAALLEANGHEVVEVAAPFDQQFADDFTLYWSFLAFNVLTLGKRVLPGFDPSKLDTLSVGLAEHYRANARQTPGMIARLRRSSAVYSRLFGAVDVLLSPVLAHTTPLLGHLSPRQPFEQMFARLLDYVGFTPLNNATGSPAMSLPLGQTAAGMPIGVHFSAPIGDERTLLELAYELEQSAPFPRIT